MSKSRDIYIKLLDEGVDVWRPVRAVMVSGDVFRIDEQPYDREDETWQFQPGELVRCEMVQTSDGSILAAVRREVELS